VATYVDRVLPDSKLTPPLEQVPLPVVSRVEDDGLGVTSSPHSTISSTLLGARIMMSAL
jgi:hypothetical protein